MSSPSDILQDRFLQYSSFGDKKSAGQLDGNMFVKLCKETGVINKNCTKTDCDLIFAKVKSKGGRKLDYRQFQESLIYLSEKRFNKTFKEQGKEEAIKKLEELITKSEGPKSNATKADNVKWHDDKSTYTGVYAKGGPTNVDKVITLSNLLDRTPADARGIKKF